MDAAASCSGAGASIRYSVFSRNIANALHPVFENYIIGHQLIILIDLGFEECKEVFCFLLKIWMNVHHHASRYNVVHGKPCAAGFFHDIIDGFAFTKCMKEWCERSY